MAVVGGLLYFNARDGVHGHELWVSDGTNAGTRMIKDINPGSASSTPFFFTGANGLVFFSARTPPPDVSCGGLTAPKRARSEWSTRHPGTGWSDTYPIGEHGGKLYFSGAAVEQPVREARSTELTAPRTAPRLFRDTNGRVIHDIYRMVKLNSTMIFSGEFGMWRSMGTSATTKKISSTSGLQLHPVQRGAVLRRPPGEIWKTDGTKAGTVKITQDPRSMG